MAQAFAATHGVEVADIIMEHLPPEGWRELATKTDVATQGQLLRSEFESQSRLLRRDLETQGQQLRSEFESQGRLLRRDLESQMSGLRDELRGEMSTLRTELRGEMSALRDEVKSEISDLRNGLRANLAEGFAQQLKWLVGTMVALFTVMSGLVSVLVVVAK